MFENTISATFGYVDGVIIAILAICLIVGLIRGFSKSLKGFFLGIAIILSSVMLLGVTFEPVRVTGPMTQLESAIGESSGGWGAAFTSELYNDNGNYFIISEGNRIPLGEVDGTKGKLAAFLAGQFSPESGVTLAEVIVGNITSLIVALILFIGYCIGFGIVCAVIRNATKGMRRSDSTAAKVIDRVGGGVVAVALGFMSVLLLLAIFSAMQNIVPSLIGYIQDSVLGKFFYDMNPIGKVFEQIFVK